jgi:hypothetical protein
VQALSDKLLIDLQKYLQALSDKLLIDLQKYLQALSDKMSDPQRQNPCGMGILPVYS